MLPRTTFVNLDITNLQDPVWNIQNPTPGLLLETNWTPELNSANREWHLRMHSDSMQLRSCYKTHDAEDEKLTERKKLCPQIMVFFLQEKALSQTPFTC